MKKISCKRMVSLLVVLCMLISLMPVTVTADDTEHTYEYAGARLDKEYDGNAVSIEAKDIEVDGQAGKLTDADISISWYNSAGGLSSAPSAVGSYTVVVSLTDMVGADSTIISMQFAIWEKGHTHTFGSWTPNNDGKTHSRSCTSDEANEGCGYIETETHNFGEWQEVVTHGQQGEFQYRVCDDCGFSEERTGVYTVTYDYETNGGASASVTSKEAEYGTIVDLTPTAAKSGYEFAGWSLKEGSTDVVDATWAEGNKVSYDLTLYAVFKKTQNVRFYSQNGILQATVTVDVYNNETKAFYELTSDYPSGLYPENYEGYTTQGWSADTEATSNNLVDLHDDDGSPMIPDVTKDYYAVYSREIKLTYDTDDRYGSWYESGTQYYNSADNYSEAEFDVSAITATTAVEDFLYWAEGSKTGKKYNPGDKIKITEDTTLYAVFEGDIPEPTAEPTPVPTPIPTPTPTPAPSFVKMVYIRFYSGTNGTIQTTIGVASYDDGSRGVFETKIPLAIDGWNAIGWRTDDKTEAPEYKAGEYVTSGSALNYYAVYSRDLTVSYNTDGGSAIEAESKTQYLNSAGGTSKVSFTLPAAPVKTGDTFKSWAVGSKSGEKHSAGDTITVSEDAEIYAVWQSDERALKKYTVTYDYASNGGNSITAPSNTDTVTEGDKLALADTNTAGIKDGYEFVGWNTDKNAYEGLEEYTVTGDVTLYAIYKKEITAKVLNTPIAAALYNNTVFAVITLPEPPAESGWEANGWRDESGAAYKTGAVKISADTTFIPSYKRSVTLVYDTNGSSDSIGEQLAFMYKNGADTSSEVFIRSAIFELAAPPQRSGYTFTGWIVSTDAAKVCAAGDRIALMENAVAKAHWQKNPEPEPEEVTVTYNASANGGVITSTTAQLTVRKGKNADFISVKAERNGYEFVGWNTDMNAHEALTQYTVKEDTTLYAIFKKDITATFLSGAEISEANKTVLTETLWNNDKSVTIVTPIAAVVDGWLFEGWRSDRHTSPPQYSAFELIGSYERPIIEVSSDTVFYAIYSRQLHVNAGNGAFLLDKQYSNTAGGVETVAYMLEEPDKEYIETEGTAETLRFTGWEVLEIDEVTGEETVIAVQEPGTVVSVSQNITVRAKYVNVPEGASLPAVETLGASVESSTSAILSEKAETDNIAGNEIISKGFVYWSKLGNESKYTVASDDNNYKLENLSPDTEYYYYAYAENAAGTAKGYIKSFKTASDGNTPNALMINPEYVSIEKGMSYQLLATLLPVAADNKIIWSSSDEKKVTVDENGMLTGISAGEGIIITATTEVGRLTAECIVDVTDTSPVKEMNFSEWHMASHTRSGAAYGFDWDTADGDGGNHTIATAYLARWEGAVLEENDMYPKYASNPPSKTVDADYHVQNVEWLPEREDWDDNDEIKAALMEYGAVYTLMCIDWDCFDDNSTNYYCPDEIYYNGHAITIVGWDDDYPASNFVQAPPGNGAFICKNSWGEYSGEDGFFYISYYDANMGRMDSNAVVTGAESNTNYNTIYQYDPLGAVGYLGFYDTTYAANVFPENGKALSKNEELEAVSFYTYHKNTSYDVYVVTDYNDKNSLKSLTSPLASGVIKNSGYHTVNLKKSVSLKSGTRFAVVVKLDTPDECSYVYCEYPVEGYSSGARAGEDESYYSSDGKEWDDLTGDVENANFCIKAFTDNGTAQQSAQLFSAIDNENREYESDRIYTLSEAIDIGMPISDEYIDYAEKTESETTGITLMSEGEKVLSLGSMPSIIKAGSNSVTYTEGARFPSRYNLNEMGLVSSVKNQGEWGTCWAHAMYASLESCMLRRGKTTSSDSQDPEVILSRSELTMSPGSSTTLAKKITPLSAEDKTVIWVSSDETVATVDTNGTIRAVGSGRATAATISATTVSGGYSARCSVVLESDDVPESVDFEEKVVNKEVGDVFMVAYSVTPMKAEQSTFGWISSNSIVAAVNENGVITAKADGTAEISIISDSGEIKDTVTVVVGSGFNYDFSEIDDDGLTYENSTLAGDVTVKLNSNFEGEQSASVILAVYNNETNAMAGIASVPVLLTSGENTVKFENISFEEIAQGNYTIKCFAWNSLGNITPLSEALKKSVTVE